MSAGVCKSLITYNIDPERCTGCGLCARNCPQNCISGEKKSPHVIDEPRCIRCGMLPGFLQVLSGQREIGAEMNVIKLQPVKKIPFKINGQAVEAEPGWTVLDTARHYGVYIPTLCFHEAVQPSGACRMCVVEVRDGDWSKIVISCMYTPYEGVEIETDSPRVLNVRRWILEMLLAECPASLELKTLAARYGVAGTRFRIENPEEQCLLCGLCVRVCEEIVGAQAIAFGSRGTSKHIATPYMMPSDACVACGACVAVCPTGAMSARIDKVRGTCPNESATCRLRGGNAMSSQKKENKVVSGVFLCQCGGKIADKVNLPLLRDLVMKESGSAAGGNPALSLHGSGPVRNQTAGGGESLDRIVIAGCESRVMLKKFERELADVDLDQGQIEVVNLRDHVACVHREDPDRLARKGAILVNAAVAGLESLKVSPRTRIDFEGPVMIVGGGIATYAAAQELLRREIDTIISVNTDEAEDEIRMLHEHYPANAITTTA
jgi:heterodisulfide reductase subunit A-like polyferredoxin